MLRVYNTLTRTKEPFEPVTPGTVGIYLCGPTVYKPSHIGHMVGPVIFDAVKRYLAYSGYKVTLVVNITDVDDKLIAESNGRGIPMAAVGQGNDGRLHEQPRGLGRRRDRPLPALHRDDRRDYQVHADVGREGFCLRGAGRRLFRGRQVSRLRQAEPSRHRGHARRRRRHGRAKTGRAPISPCGSRPSRASPRGQAPGATAGPAGTSNARP